jgi:glycosyltransferase involved in cell wall biosynthesis
VINILGLALYGPLAASHRVRLGQYRSGLLAAGIDLQVHSLLGNRYLQSRFESGQQPIAPVITAGVERLRLLLGRGRFDGTIVHCELFPLMPGWLECALLRSPYIYDFDDAFYLRYRSGRMAGLNPVLGGKFDRVIRGAAATTAGNMHLAAYASALNANVTVLPSVVDTDTFCPRESPRNPIFTVGWIGSPSTAEYLRYLVAPLQRLGEKATIRLVVVGGKAPHITNVEVVEIPWAEEIEVELINTFDVGVMPLPDDDWARGKCAYKLVQYMACGVPVVASRVGANIDLVTSECGFLVETDEEWVDTLTQLREQPELRQRMGAMSRKRVLDAYSLESNLPLLEKVIRKVTGKN